MLAIRQAATDLRQHQVLKVDTFYAPAREVGGDFYHQIPGEDGSLLIVVGDVSGKGLNAAMLVASVVGALGNQFSRLPGQVLSHLNRALEGKTSGGFVTCRCALLHSDGSAEHISPYLGDQSLELDSGLPPGLSPDAEYPESSVTLNGQTLTSLSDGVPEARNAKGELFGFDHTAAIMQQTAASIAKSAQDFGQDDDITVLKVTRLAVNM